MFTYQDFQKEIERTGIEGAIATAIQNHINSDMYKTALSADNYNKQKNELISSYIRTILSLTGTPIQDFTVSNNKISSNFFHRLNTQRCMYLLGNGVSFSEHREKTKDEDGNDVTRDLTKERLGNKFDVDLRDLAYKALIHGVSFGFWNVDKLHVYPFTEFVPLWDDENGDLRVGIRFWQIDKNKPVNVELYEEDGISKYRSKDGSVGYDFELRSEKTPYKQKYTVSIEGGEDFIGGENYSRIPVVPMWGSKLHQSTLIGMKEKIDSFDLIRSGFANDLTDCAEIYWIVENCGGMSEAELERFRDRLKINHIAIADTENSNVKPYTQEIPYAARKEYLDEIRSGIYEDFGALDVHTVAAGATNDHIDAAYQPLDEESDEFEYQVTEFIQGILALMDISDTPVFKRNRISNQKEQTDMVLSASDYLDTETILQKLPWVTVDEISGILIRKMEESEERMVNSELTNNPPEEEEEEIENTNLQ